MRTNNANFRFKVAFLLIISLGIVGCNNDSLGVEKNIELSEVDITEEHEALAPQITEQYKMQLDETGSNKVKDVDTEFISSLNGMKSIPLDLKIIKTANTKYKVKSIAKATDEIQNAVVAFGGYISEMRYEHNTYEKENRFTIKIPQLHFKETLDKMEDISEFIDHINISTHDVTEEYVDIKTRLATKREVKARYENILRNRARSVEDILKAERQIQTLQEEIESAEGRLKYLTNRVSFSTIQVELYETVELQDKPSVYKRTFGSKAGDSLKFGWEGIQVLILSILHIWPLLLVATGIIIWYKRRKRNKQ